MPATKTQLTGGAFQDSEGNVLASGYLEFALNQDESVASVGNIASGVTIKILLDSSGNVVASPAQSMWANDVMLPVNSFYRVTGFTAKGQPAWGPNNQQITSGGTGGGTFDLGTWVPNQVISWTPPLQALDIQHNGTDNTSQLLLNFVDTASITWSNPSGGVIEATAVTGPTVDFKHNGTDNSSQTLLNFVDTATVTWTNPSGGIVEATAVGPSLSTSGQGFFFGQDSVGPKIGSPVSNSGAFNNRVALDVNVVPLVLEVGYTVRKITFNLTGNSYNGEVVHIGIYSANGNTLLLDAGAITLPAFSGSNAVVQVTLGSPVVLPAGAYIFAFGCESGSPTTTTGSDLSNLLPDLNASFVRVGYASNQINSGSHTLPATLGTINARAINVLGCMFEV